MYVFSLKMRNVLEKNCKENQQIRFKFNEFSSPENHAAFAIMWKNMVELFRSQMAM